MTPTSSPNKDPVLSESQLDTLQTLALQRASVLLRKNWYRGDMDRDDIAQELVMRVWQRAKQFDEVRLGWEQFCQMILSQGLVTLFKRYFGPKQRQKRDWVSLTQWEDELAENKLLGNRMTHVDEWILQEDVQTLLGHLKGPERDLAEQILNQARGSLHKDKGIPRRQIEKILRKIQSLFNDWDCLAN